MEQEILTFGNHDLKYKNGTFIYCECTFIRGCQYEENSFAHRFITFYFYTSNTLFSMEILYFAVHFISWF